MASKITAQFGADVSEVEAKMMAVTRSANYYKKAVDSIDGKKIPDLTTRLGRSNEQLAKGLNLLKGGAIVAGANMLIGFMKSWADHAKSMGKEATEAQKSAAKWGDELQSFKDSITSTLASGLGKLAGWGREIGDKFRSPLERSYDAVAESSGKMADKQEADLARVKKAHEEAAKRIPELIQKQQKAEEDARIQKMTGGDAEAIAQTKILQIEKELAAIQKGPKNAITEARRIELDTDLIEQREVARKEAAKHESERQAKAAAEAKEAADKIAKATEDSAKRQAEAAAELAKMAEEKRQSKMTDEQKLAEVIEKGRKAQAKAEKSGLATDKLEVEKLREEYDDLTESIKASKDAQAAGGSGASGDSKFSAIGLTRGEDGKLRRGKQIISEEDAKRTIATRERNEKFASRTGRSKSEEANYLARIEKLLTPGDI